MANDYAYITGMAQRLGLRYEELENTDDRLAMSVEVGKSLLVLECVPGSGEARSVEVKRA